MDKLLKVAYGLFIALVLVAALYVAPSCSEGTSYVNDHYAQFDERLTMLEVNAILHPGDSKHFVFYAISGSALFYGRTMMWVDAMASYIPDKIWGVQGQVMATRMMHLLVLLLALHLLIRTFVQDSLLRLCLLMFTILSPYFFYFSLIPKPEPFVLFFLALFLRGFMKSNRSFGKHFIWLGFAFGCKLSVLPLIPLFLVLPLIYSSDKFQWNFQFMPFLKSGLWTLAGFLLCIPCLILAPIKPVFLQTYLHQALVGAKKDYDDASVNFFTWLHHLCFDHYSELPVFVVLMLVLALILAGWSLLKTRKVSQGNLLMGIALIQLLLIFVLTKRIWPHYLFVGLVFYFIAFGALMEEQLKQNRLFFAALLLPYLIYQFPAYTNEIHTYMARPNDAKYKSVMESGTKAFAYLKEKKIKSAGVDLSTYVPNAILVESQVYEPFPDQKRAKEIYTESVIDYGDLLYTSGYEAIVFEKNAPDNPENIHSNEYFLRNAKASFDKFIPSEYHLDTTFAETKVYLKNKIGK